MKIISIATLIIAPAMITMASATAHIAMLLAGMVISPLLVFIAMLAPFITGETSFVPMLIL